MPGAAAVVIGSHIDTVKDGGRFDGNLGVVSGRVGYVVAHPRVALGLRQTAVPFGVSSVAQAATQVPLTVSVMGPFP